MVAFTDALLIYGATLSEVAQDICQVVVSAVHCFQDICKALAYTVYNVYQTYASSL